MVYEFDGTEYDKLRDMQAARRAKYPGLVRGGTDFTQTARAVGVSKRTGKVWRNGRTRSTGRNEKPLMDWYRGGMDKPKTTSARYPGLDERITIADMHHAGSGHWEGDLICGAGNRSAIGTLVERTARFAILLHLPDGHDAEHVQDAIIRKMRSLPALLRNSLTWDQGSELALHRRIGAAPDMQVHSCDPHSPWQRGTNENTNGLPRQHFPKGTDLSGYTEEYPDAVAAEPDDRPRKTLDYMKPSEKILELIDDTATAAPTGTMDID